MTVIVKDRTAPHLSPGAAFFIAAVCVSPEASLASRIALGGRGEGGYPRASKRFGKKRVNGLEPSTFSLEDTRHASEICLPSSGRRRECSDCRTLDANASNSWRLLFADPEMKARPDARSWRAGELREC